MILGDDPGVMILGSMILGRITTLSVSSIWTPSLSTGPPGSVVTLSWTAG